ncbi:MAG: hypothetical protein MJ252_05950 [archaeon]|nr:hypothetical protein [archaeon]
MEKEEEKINEFSKKIFKYPVNGTSTNLIDKFLIISYNMSTITKGLSQFYLDNKDTINEGLKKKNLFEIYFTEKPSVMNEIINDYKKNNLPNSSVIDFIFPRGAKIYFTKKGVNPIIEMPNIVFLNACDNLKGTSKIMNVYFSKVNYELYTFEDKNIYFPRVFVINSEYPYFASFSLLIDRISHLFHSEHLKFPLEVLIYNMVKYLPAPIKQSILLDTGKLSPNTINSSFMAPLNTLNESTFNSLDILKNRNRNLQNKIYFPMLSGFPLAQYNLSIIFHIINYDLLFEAFLLTFLDQDLLIFSQNLEVLNIVLYSLYLFNYPCNDSCYFWQPISISLEEFMSDECVFAKKLSTIMLGINATYDPKYDTTDVRKEHFILDLDNHQLIFKSEEPNEKLESLLTYFKEFELLDLIYPKKYEGEINSALRWLFLEMVDVSNKSKKKLEKIDIFIYDENVKESNKSIQEMFYLFFLKIMAYFYKNLSLEESTNLQKRTKKEKENKIYDKKKAERKFSIALSRNTDPNIFYEYFNQTSKLNSYLIDFMLHFNTMDSLKIPLLFTDELAHFIRHNVKFDIEKGLDIFEIINNFYVIEDLNKVFGEQINQIPPQETYRRYSSKHKSINNEEENEEYEEEESSEEEKIYEIPLNMFIPQIDLIQIYLYREKFDYPNFVNNRKGYFYNQLQLDNDYLLNYVLQCKKMNIENDIEKTIIDNYKGINIFDNINQCYVRDIFEQYLFEKNFYKNEFYYIFSIFIVFAITRNICISRTPKEEIDFLNYFLKSNKVNLRKYLNIILTVYYKLMEHFKQSNRRISVNKNIFEQCFNSLSEIVKNKNILPSEELLELMNKGDTEVEGKSEDSTSNLSGAEDTRDTLNEYEDKSYIPLISYYDISVKEVENSLDKALVKYALISKKALLLDYSIILDNYEKELKEGNNIVKFKDLSSPNTPLTIVGSVYEGNKGEQKTQKNYIAMEQMQVFNFKKMFLDATALLSNFCPWDDEYLLKNYQSLYNLIWNIILYSKNMNIDNILEHDDQKNILNPNDSIETEEDKKYNNPIAIFFAKIYLRLYIRKNPGGLNLKI